MRHELEDKEALKTKVKNILNEIKTEKKQSINTTDSDSKSMRTRQGPVAGYNAQLAVDEKHGLIVNSDVVSDNHDYHQFSEQVNQANEVLSRPCKTACADAGYADTNVLAIADEQGIKVIVPSQRQASKKEHGKFNKSQFKYDSQDDVYICPEGQVLKFYGINEKRKNEVLRCRSYMPKLQAFRKMYKEQKRWTKNSKVVQRRTS